MYSTRPFSRCSHGNFGRVQRRRAESPGIPQVLVDREPQGDENARQPGKGKAQGYSIRTNRYRINRWQNNGITDYELYDHRYDNKELKNLANSDDYRGCDFYDLGKLTAHV